MKEVIAVEISDTGETVVSVEGCPGPSCKDLTKQLERALGNTEECRKTQEYSRASNRNQQQAGR